MLLRNTDKRRFVFLVKVAIFQRVMKHKMNEVGFFFLFNQKRNLTRGVIVQGIVVFFFLCDSLYAPISTWTFVTCCPRVVSCRSGLQRRGRAVRWLRVTHSRSLPAARQRALLARDVRQVRRVSERAQRHLLLQRPATLLQARLWEVSSVSHTAPHNRPIM